MSVIEVVENPRKRRRRRMSPLQRKYFGKRRKTARRRRRNPVLATLGNPRRRTYRRASKCYYRRRRRNPALGNFLPVTLTDLAGLTAGAVGSKIIPGLVRNFAPTLPGGPFVDYGIRVGGLWALSQLVGMMLGARVKQNVFTGGLVAVAVDLWNEYGAPNFPALGIGYDGYLSTTDVDLVTDGGVSGYVSRPALGEYVARNNQPLMDYAY